MHCKIKVLNILYDAQWNGRLWRRKIDILRIAQKKAALQIWRVLKINLSIIEHTFLYKHSEYIFLVP